MTFADCPDGTEDVECDECNASVEIHYQTSIAIKRVVFIDIPSTKLKSPYDGLSRKTLEKKDGIARKSACPICRNTVSSEAIQIADLPEGTEEVNCVTCNADLEVEYRPSIRVTKTDVTDAPDGECSCPKCEASVELYGTEIESEKGDIEVECGECGASLEVSWSNWGEDADAALLYEGEAESSAKRGRHSLGEHPQASAPECPRCGADLQAPDDSDTVECENCGASVEITLSSKGKVTDVELEEVPDATVSCPECDDELTIDGEDIEEESGTLEVTCGCNAVLEVTWSDWGNDCEANVLEEGEDDEDEEDNEEQ